MRIKHRQDMSTTVSDLDEPAVKAVAVVVPIVALGTILVIFGASGASFR